ncbi:MAG: hypothetical protein AAB490_05170 [Patescibacteria group bacterium]
MMDDRDKALFEKIEERILDGLDESNAITFLAKLSLDEYDRLIALLGKVDATSLPDAVRAELISIFQRLRDAKKQAQA